MILLHSLLHCYILFNKLFSFNVNFFNLQDTSKDVSVTLSVAFSKRSGSEMDRAKREASSNVAMLLGELDGALEKLGLHATSVNQQLIEARTQVHQEREMILDMLHGR